MISFCTLVAQKQAQARDRCEAVAGIVNRLLEMAHHHWNIILLSGSIVLTQINMNSGLPLEMSVLVEKPSVPYQVDAIEYLSDVSKWLMASVGAERCTVASKEDSVHYEYKLPQVSLSIRFLLAEQFQSYTNIGSLTFSNYRGLTGLSTIENIQLRPESVPTDGSSLLQTFLDVQSWRYRSLWRSQHSATNVLSSLDAAEEMYKLRLAGYSAVEGEVCDFAEGVCPICLIEELCCKLKCGHVIHPWCARNLTGSASGSCKCPICRSDLQVSFQPA